MHLGTCQLAHAGARTSGSQATARSGRATTALCCLTTVLCCLTTATVPQAQDYRIQYDSIVRVFLLPKTNVPQVGPLPTRTALALGRTAVTPGSCLCLLSSGLHACCRPAPSHCACRACQPSGSAAVCSPAPCPCALLRRWWSSAWTRPSARARPSTTTSCARWAAGEGGLGRGRCTALGQLHGHRPLLSNVPRCGFPPAVPRSCPPPSACHPHPPCSCCRPTALARPLPAVPQRRGGGGGAGHLGRGAGS